MDVSIQFLRCSQALHLRAGMVCRARVKFIPQLDLFWTWSIFIWLLFIHSLTQHPVQLLITLGVYSELVWVMYTLPLISNPSHQTILCEELPFHSTVGCRWREKNSSWVLLQCAYRALAWLISGYCLFLHLGVRLLLGCLLWKILHNLSVHETSPWCSVKRVRRTADVPSKERSDAEKKSQCFDRDPEVKGRRESLCAREHGSVFRRDLEVYAALNCWRGHCCCCCSSSSQEIRAVTCTR